MPLRDRPAVGLRFWTAAGFNLVSSFISGPTYASSPPLGLASRPIQLKADSSGAVPAEQIRELLERAEEKELENEKSARDYTYVERVERHELGGAER